MTGYSRLATVALALLAAAPAAAQDVTTVSTHGSWTAYATKEDKGKACYVVANPGQSEGKYGKRGDVYLMVTHRPSAKSLNVVSLLPGYPYKPGTPVTLAIGEKKFKLAGNGDTAWAIDAAADLAIVTALKAGKQVVVSGASARGTETRDTFSLTGFPAAYAAIGKTCNVK